MTFARSIVARFVRCPRLNPMAYLPATLAGLAAVSALVVIGLTAAMVILCRQSIPYGDQWENLISGRQVGWAWLLSQHNEHRLFFPRLIFWADAALCHERNDLSLAVSFALQLATASLMAVLARRALAAGRLAAVTVTGFCFALTFSALQWANFTSGFQVAFFLVCFAAAATSAIVVYGGQGWSSVWPILALDAVATYSLASGILVPMVAVALALGARRPSRQIAVLALAAALLLAAYLRGYQPPAATPGVAWSPGVLPDLTAYVLNELGTFPAALFGLGALWLRLGVGGGGLLLLAALLLTNHARARPAARRELSLFGIALFVLGTCALTAIGRLPLGIEQATAGRYATPVLLFWVALSLLAVSRLWSRARAWGLAGFAALALVAAIREPHFAAIALSVERGIDAGVPAALVMNGDRAMLAHLYPDPEAVVARLPLLEAAQSSVFSEPWSHWLGQPFPAGRPAAGLPQCHGDFADPVPVSDGSRAGWRVTGHLAAPGPFASHLVLLDAAGRVVGLGVVGLSAYALDVKNSLKSHASDRWLGETIAIDPHEVTAYALDSEDRAVCSLGSAP